MALPGACYYSGNVDDNPRGCGRKEESEAVSPEREQPVREAHETDDARNQTDDPQRLRGVTRHAERRKTSCHCKHNRCQCKRAQPVLFRLVLLLSCRESPRDYPGSRGVTGPSKHPIPWMSALPRHPCGQAPRQQSGLSSLPSPVCRGRLLSPAAPSPPAHGLLWLPR
jgi:hypothetical protein